jgi:hypothetical protein
MESNRTMFIFYITNLLLYGFYIYILKIGLFSGKCVIEYFLLIYSICHFVNKFMMKLFLIYIILFVDRKVYNC